MRGPTEQSLKMQRRIDFDLLNTCLKELIDAVQNLLWLVQFAEHFLKQFSRPIQMQPEGSPQETGDFQHNMMADNLRIGKSIVEQCKQLLLEEMGQQVVFYSLPEELDCNYKTNWREEVLVRRK
jgi:hypothetical protein